MRKKHLTTDVVIIGSGIAGMMAALEMSRTRKVTMLTKTSLGAGNSVKAQGGIAAALHRNKEDESLHVNDTLTAGNGCNDINTVESLIQEAPRVMECLLKSGVPFDTDTNGHFQLAREGAHSLRRIFHAGGDATGYWIMSSLKKALPAHIEVLENVMAHDLLMDNGICDGVYGTNKQGETIVVHAAHTVLATGGGGQLYSTTSNAEEATGDGYAMAYRAGAELVDMEFLQFHPTMLSIGGKGAGLLSEAIRGEGGTLIDENERPIMQERHPLGDLAPRDVVAKAVYDTEKSGKQVYLSIQQIADFEKKFPSIAASVREHGVSIEAGVLPIRPGAHFMMGGVAADASGQTTVTGLYAIGEVACTGMHGSNRLASNSLLEGAASALLLARELSSIPERQAGDRRLPLFQGTSSSLMTLPDKEEVQEKMDQWVGIVREETQLRRMLHWLASYRDNIFSPIPLEASKEEVERINMLVTAWMMTQAALLRTETRGAHIREDYPYSRNEWKQKRIEFQIRREAPAIIGRLEKEAVH